MVVWRVIGPVDLGANEGANLDNDVVGSGRDGPLLDVKTVLGDPGGYDGVEVRICFCPESAICWDLRLQRRMKR
jgi:hypothetical protein